MTEAGGGQVRPGAAANLFTMLYERRVYMPPPGGKDRLSRYFEQVTRRFLARHGIRVVAWFDGGNHLEQADKRLRFVEGWQAETESVNTRVRVTNAMKHMAESGVWTGGKVPYGCRLRELKLEERQAAGGKAKERPVHGI